LFESTGGSPASNLADHAEYQRNLAAIQARLKLDVFAASWAAGRKLTIGQVLVFLEEIFRQNPPMPPPLTTAAHSTTLAQASTEAQHLADLTEREFEVLRLLVQGLTYAQMAEQLVVSPRTVDAHLRAIYSKLGVRSRHEATRSALEHNLV
jgi:DNA-binding NarL/FixJ family response regulator